MPSPRASSPASAPSTLSRCELGSSTSLTNTWWRLTVSETRFLPSSAPYSRQNTQSSIWASPSPSGKAFVCWREARLVRLETSSRGYKTSGSTSNSLTIASSVLLSVVIAAISLTMLAPYTIDFTRAATAAAQLFSLIDRKSAIDPFDKSGEQPAEPVGSLELEEISFSYPTRPGVTVLDRFSLEVPAGKVTALVASHPIAVRLASC